MAETYRCLMSRNREFAKIKVFILTGRGGDEIEKEIVSRVLPSGNKWDRDLCRRNQLYIHIDIELYIYIYILGSIILHGTETRPSRKMEEKKRIILEIKIS